MWLILNVKKGILLKKNGLKNGINWNQKLQAKAKKHDVLDVLKKLIQLKKKIEKEKVDQKQATELLEKIIRKS